MTIRLLSTYRQFKPNTNVTLAAGTETALVAGGNATTDLSGGVPYDYKLPQNTRQNGIAYAPDGVPLGYSDSTGKILQPFTGITAPGAPTGLALTSIAGGVLATFTPSATLGGTGTIGYEVTLSTGQVQLGETNTITVNAPAGVAVTATVKQINGYDKSVASAASASATPTAYVTPAVPGAPSNLTLTAGNGKVTASWTAGAANGSAIRNTVVTLSNGAVGVAQGSATTVDIITPNGQAVTATARANNGEGASVPSAVSNSATPAVSVPFMLAGNRTAFCPSTSALTVVSGNQYECNSLEFVSPPYETWDTVFSFAAFILQPETSAATAVEIPLGNNIDIEGAVLVFGGNSYPLTFGGAAAKTILDGTYAHSDPVSVHIPANTAYKLRFADRVDVGGKRPYPYFGQSTDGQNASATTQSVRLTSGSFTTPGRATPMFGPCMIVARGWSAVATSATEPPVVLGSGDSIRYGANDTNTAIAPAGVFGHANRALNDSATSTRFASCNFASPGARITSISGASGKFAIREQMLRDFNFPFTVWDQEIGVNSTASLTLAQCIADATAAAAYMKSLGNKRVVWSLQTPQTSMSGNTWFTDVATQSRGTVTEHDGFDNWLLGMPANVDAVIDARAAFQDAGSPGKWKVPPINALNPTLVTAITAGAGTSLVVDQQFAVDDLISIEVGSANREVRTVWTVTGTGPYTLGVNGTSFANSHAAGVSVKAQYVADGTHPSTPGAQLGKAAYIQAKNASVYSTRPGVYATT